MNYKAVLLGAVSLVSVAVMAGCGGGGGVVKHNSLPKATPSATTTAAPSAVQADAALAVQNFVNGASEMHLASYAQVTVPNALNGNTPTLSWKLVFKGRVQPSPGTETACFGVPGSTPKSVTVTVYGQVVLYYAVAQQGDEVLTGTPGSNFSDPLGTATEACAPASAP